jgi:hypothetical protein
MCRWLLVLGCIVALPLTASPCTGIDRTLTAAQKQSWMLPIAQQLKLSRVDVLQSFRVGSWRVIYVDTHVSDPGFLFYRNDPRRSTYIDIWAGSAMPDEQASISRWVQANVPGIPPALVRCFAWHVTQDRGG